MPEHSRETLGGITQQDFSVIQGAVAALRLMIDNKSVPLSDIAADVGIAYQRFAAGGAADVAASAKAVAKARDGFNNRVASWQRDLRAALAGAPKTLKTKLEGQLQMGTGRAHNLANSFDMLIARIEEWKPRSEDLPIEAGEPVESGSSEEDAAPAITSADAEQGRHDRIPALRTVMSGNGLVLADVLTDRPAKSGEPGVRLIVYCVNNITTIGDVIRDDREPEWLPTEHGEVKRPIIGSIPFSVGGVTGTVAGAYKLKHIEVRASFRSDHVVKHGITLNQQVREGNILYVFLAKRDAPDQSPA
jgi:hypothetical protein